MQTTLIKVKDHVAEYISIKYKSENEKVKLPNILDVSFLIADLLIKKPINVTEVKGNLEIELPSIFSGKRTDKYNYISSRGASQISDRLEVMMWADLHAFIDQKKHEEGMNIIDSITRFMCKYCIESISEDAFVKNYYRWQTAVRKYNKRNYERKLA